MAVLNHVIFLPNLFLLLANIAIFTFLLTYFEYAKRYLGE